MYVCMAQACSAQPPFVLLGVLYGILSHEYNYSVSIVDDLLDTIDLVRQP